jgi:hypothetical protein
MIAFGFHHHPTRKRYGDQTITRAGEAGRVDCDDRTRQLADESRYLYGDVRRDVARY